MDSCLQASPLLSWSYDRRKLLTGQTRLSSSQLGILARKLDHRGALIRCRAAESGGETVSDKRGSKTATLEEGDDVDSGNWLESHGKPDLFSGWISNGSLNARPFNAAGWMTIGGVIVLTLGFTVGARTLYLKRDIARQSIAGPPATEETLPSFSKATDVENTVQNADLNGNHVSEKSGEGLEETKQQNGKEDILEVQVGEDESRPLLSAQNMGPEDQTVEEPGINDDPVSVSSLDSLGNTDESPKSVEITHQDPPEHTSAMDATTATESDLSPKAAQSSEVTNKDVNPSFTYADGDDINTILDESDVSDRFLSEEFTFDESLVAVDDLYEGAQKKNSVFEDDEDLSREESVSQAPVKGRKGFLPAVITAPSTPAESLGSPLGDVVVPAHVNHMQEQILGALQALKVVEADVKAGDICTRREYARWLMSASALLTRSPAHKVLPAMYIENVSVVAYDDVTPEDQDFPSIQGLAEAGLLSSKLLEDDHHGDVVKETKAYIFSPDRHLTRQDLVTWKVALERKPAVTDGIPTGTELTVLQDILGFIDLDKLHKDALPALLMDLSAGEQSIVALAFGHTRRLQPQKLVTKGQAAVALATGEAWEFVSEELARLEAESVAEAAVVAELALEAKAQEEVAAAFEKLLQTEREKQKASASMVESLQAELEQIKTLHETEKHSLLKDRAAIEAERDLLLRASNEVEQHATALSSAKVEAAFHQEKTEKLLREAEEERALISNVRSELEIEKHALTLARSWAENEARKAQEHVKVLEQARKRWEGQGIQQNVDMNEVPEKMNSSSSLQDTDKVPVSELDKATTEKSQVNNSLTDRVLDRSKEAGQIVLDALVRFFNFLQLMLHMIMQWTIAAYGKAKGKFHEVRVKWTDSSARSVEGLKERVPSSVARLSSNVREGSLKVVDEWKEGAEKISQKFKTS